VPRLADDADGLDLLTRMLLFQPASRISAREALNHRWFNDPSLDALKAGM
jgi:serine/threonine protein kinase